MAKLSYGDLSINSKVATSNSGLSLEEMLGKGEKKYPSEENIKNDSKINKAITVNKNTDGSIKYTFDNIYEDKELISVAKDYYTNRDSEVYDDKTGGSKETTIFNTTTKIKAKQDKPESKAEFTPRRRGRAPTDKGKNTGRKDLLVAVKAAFWLLLILIGGLGVLYGFEGLNNFLNKF